MNSFRISFGDSLFDQLQKQTPAEDRIYWCVWVLCFILACLIFLNFIIAEVIHSYRKAKHDIKAHVYKERASMIMAVEAFLPQSYKEAHPHQFPKYVVIRETER